jgi:hypothetical protein
MKIFLLSFEDLNLEHHLPLSLSEENYNIIGSFYLRGKAKQTKWSVSAYFFMLIFLVSIISYILLVIH